MDKTKIPQHIAIIMDGNGRWAKNKHLPKIMGHRAGVLAVERTIKSCINLGVRILSLYAFSTENWQRSKLEVKALMAILKVQLKRYLPKLQKNKVRLVVAGKITGLPVALQKQLQDVIRQTKDNSKLILNLAINYGGREEILRATKDIAKEVVSGKLKLDDVNEETFARHLYTEGLVDPDLLIRTSGEQRLSNFFLWQISYSEFYFTRKLWPEFGNQDLIAAISEYQKRDRRFGGRAKEAH